MTQEKKTPAPTGSRLLIAGVGALLAAYIFGSLAIDRGSYWYYALTLVSLYFGGHYLWRGFKASKKHHE